MFTYERSLLQAANPANAPVLGMQVTGLTCLFLDVTSQSEVFAMDGRAVRGLP